MYAKMLEYVKEALINSGGEFVNFKSVPFRKRSEHIKRVFIWAERIMDGMENINKEALLTAAAFHDAGYNPLLGRSDHAETSAVICEKYLKDNGYDAKLTDFVVYLVRNHSRKELMTSSDTPLELILLMEADLLDETGALSIVWDCMAEGAEEVQSFEKTYEHIMKFSYDSLKENPMITEKAKVFWEEKQNLMKEFTRQLSFDLGIK
jgi:uncharacterized protein